LIAQSAELVSLPEHDLPKRPPGKESERAGEQERAEKETAAGGFARRCAAASPATPKISGSSGLKIWGNRRAV
jgi:hypothetical protein